MSVPISQKDYLKKYLAIGKAPGDKKRKKKKALNSGRITIIDDDADHIAPIVIVDDPLIVNEDAPQIVAIIDERPPSLRVDDKTQNPLWRPIGSVDGGASADQKKLIAGFKIGPKLMEKNCANSTIQAPPRKKHLSADDKSPTRKSSKEGDYSPPRGSKRTESRSNDDYSPPRKIKKEDDNTPPRRPNKANDDNSPARRSRKTDDTSPPRRYKKTDDISPPRKSKFSDNNSPPRRSKKADDTSPSRRSKKIDDISPPRKSRFGDNNSPPRRSKKTDDSSPPRRSKRRWDEPPSSRSEHKEKPPGIEKKGSIKMDKTLDGKTAGLQDARQLAEETKQFRTREDQQFISLPQEVSGKDAETVHRDRKTGKIRNLEEEQEYQRQKLEAEAKEKEKYTRWGRGLAQVESHQQQVQEELHEMNKPLARYADDEDLERFLKEQEREGDPMLAYIRSKKKKKAADRGEVTKPKFEGEFMPNRYGVRPGHRWDGVDRSNGYEKRWFEVQNAKMAQQEDIYKWSTEDM